MPWSGPFADHVRRSIVVGMRDYVQKALDIIGPSFWAAAGGVLALYAFGLVMGVFDPGQLLGWTIVAAILAVLVVWHSHKVRVAIKERDPELMRSLNKAREKRGF